MQSKQSITQRHYVHWTQSYKSHHHATHIIRSTNWTCTQNVQYMYPNFYCNMGYSASGCKTCSPLCIKHYKMCAIYVLKICIQKNS